MNTLRITLTEPNEYGSRKAVLWVDGRELLDWVREVELPLAASTNEANLAGKYDYLRAETALFPSRQLLGEVARSVYDYEGDPSILECECGCEGCWPLIAKVEVLTDRVIWHHFRQWNRDAWNYPESFRFEFERAQIEAALQIELPS